MRVTDEGHVGSLISSWQLPENMLLFPHETLKSHFITYACFGHTWLKAMIILFVHMQLKFLNIILMTVNEFVYPEVSRRFCIRAKSF